MQQETARILDAVAPPLEGLLSVDFADSGGSALETLDPVVSINFWLVKGGETSRKIDTKIRPALDAVAALCQHSYALSASPSQKARLWRHVLQESSLVRSREPTGTEKDWILGDVDFPRVMLDFSRAKVSLQLTDALLSFFTAPTSSAETFPSRRAASSVRFGLRFAKSQLKTQELLWIQQLMDQVYDHPNRRFGIESLDLTDNGFNGKELEIVTAILDKNDVYQLQDVVLQNTLGRNLGDEGMEAFGSLVAAAFSADTTAKQASAPRQSVGTTLRSLQLQGNALRARSYASICSAIRRSRSVEELSLAGTLSLLDPSDREQCWRWLAFGLFHPRPKANADEQHKLRRIDLSWNPFYPRDVEVFRNTLVHPAAELVPDNDSDTEGVTYEDTTGITVRVVEKGTSVYAKADAASRRVLTADEGAQFEVLRHRGAWVCVVIPGFGLGWIFAESTVRMERETVESDAPTSRVCYELAMSNLSDTDVTSQALIAFFETVGRQISSLELRHTRFSQSVLDTVLIQCVNLERLDLDGCGFMGASMGTLLDGIRGHLGDHLISLNLNSNYIGHQFTERLAVELCNPAGAPALRELRLHNNSIGDRGLGSLYDALRVNKTLCILELDSPSGDPEFAHLVDDRVGFNAMFQGELLRVDPLQPDRKLAFLSVVTTHPDGSNTARCALDAWILASIFEFAAQDIRRRIIWR